MTRIAERLEKLINYCNDNILDGYSDTELVKQIAQDALDQLKEPEAVECINDHGILLCGRCKNIIGYDDGYGRSYISKFCGECGRAVKRK